MFKALGLRKRDMGVYNHSSICW